MSAGERLPGTPAPGYFWEGHQGLKIAGDIWGDADARPVFLLHGGGQTRHAWKRTGEVLADAGFRAIALDARGHGDSEWSAQGDYSQDAMVKDLQCVVEALGARNPVLVGASMGGGTSLVAAGEGWVSPVAVVLVDVAPRIEPEGVKGIHAFMTRNPDGFASLEEVAVAIGSYQPHRPPPKSLQGLAKNVRIASNGRYYWHWDPRLIQGQFELGRREARLRDCAKALAVPSLLVRGSQSDVISDQGVAEFLALAPRSEYLNISGAGHMVAGDRNDMFGKAVVEFLTRPGLLSEASLGDAQRSALARRLDAADLNDVP